MKISQREMILGVATLAALLTGLTWYIVDNKMDEYHAKAAEIEKLKQQIGFHKNAIKMQENWLGELNALQEDLRVFDINQKSVSPELMKTIKEISSAHGLDINRNQHVARRARGHGRVPHRSPATRRSLRCPQP
jgi:hypothetical protein